MSTPATAPSSPWKRPLLIGGLLGLVLAAGLLGWWWSQRSDAGPEASRLQALLQRQQTLQAQLAAAARPDDPASCPPGQSLRPRPQTSEVTPPAVPASAAGSGPTLTSSTPGLTALGETALAQRLEQSVALVIVAGDQSLSTGTGFFIGPRTLVTNLHVVKEANGRPLFVISKSLGSLRRARILHTTDKADIGDADFAVLSLEEGSSTGTLELASEAPKLSSVVAAGYPGVVLRGDANFQRLLQGDVAAAPDLNLTQGQVQSFQSGGEGLPLIVHTASIAKGNSGGPLVDACGRVVGINTFINVDASQGAKINYAIRSQALSSFLSAKGSAVRIDSRGCTPKV